MRLRADSRGKRPCYSTAVWTAQTLERALGPRRGPLHCDVIKEMDHNLGAAVVKIQTIMY